MTLEPKAALFQLTPRTILILLALATVLAAVLYGYDVPGYPVLDDQPNLDIISMLHRGAEGNSAVWQLVWGNHSGISLEAEYLKAQELADFLQDQYNIKLKFVQLKVNYPSCYFK